MQSSLTTHINKVCVLEGMFKEHKAIKHEVSVLWELIEHSKHSSSDSNQEYSEDESNDNDMYSIMTVTPHELEHVKEEDEEQLNFAGDSNNNLYQHIYYIYSDAHTETHSISNSTSSL